MPKSIKDRRALKKRLKRLAPRIPDFTCPDIDWVIEKAQESYSQSKPISQSRLRVMIKKLERLRSSNEALRDSGKYWYDKMGSYVFED